MARFPKSVSPGDPIPTGSEAWNAILGAAHEHRQAGRPDGPAARGGYGGVVWAMGLNSTGANLLPYKPAAVTGVGGIDVSGSDPDDDGGPPWQRRPLLTLGEPATATDWVCVTLEAIPAGEIGRVAISGVCLCYVDSAVGAKWASPQPGDTAALLGGPTGTVRVLHVPAGDSSQRRAVVYLHESPPNTSRRPLDVPCAELVYGPYGGIAGVRLHQLWFDPATGVGECRTSEPCDCGGSSPPPPPPEGTAMLAVRYDGDQPEPHTARVYDGASWSPPASLAGGGHAFGPYAVGGVVTVQLLTPTEGVCWVAWEVGYTNETSGTGVTASVTVTGGSGGNSIVAFYDCGEAEPVSPPPPPSPPSPPSPPVSPPAPPVPPEPTP